MLTHEKVLLMEGEESGVEDASTCKARNKVCFRSGRIYPINRGLVVYAPKYSGSLTYDIVRFYKLCSSTAKRDGNARSEEDCGLWWEWVLGVEDM